MTPEELRLHIADMYKDAHTPWPEVVSKDFPDTFADKMLQLFADLCGEVIDTGIFIDPSLTRGQLVSKLREIQYARLAKLTGIPNDKQSL